MKLKRSGSLAIVIPDVAHAVRSALCRVVSKNKNSIVMMMIACHGYYSPWVLDGYKVS